MHFTSNGEFALQLRISRDLFFKLRLFGSMEEPPPRDEIERVIRGAIRVFMAAYGVRRHETA